MTAADRYLFDTDVLIDLLREVPEAVECYTRAKGDLAVSVLSCVELWAGVKGKQEETLLRHLLSSLDKIEVSEPIAERACELSHRYRRSHGTGAIDTVIAATAETHGATLVTLNKKHYPMAKKLLVPYRKK